MSGIVFINALTAGPRKEFGIGYLKNYKNLIWTGSPGDGSWLIVLLFGLISTQRDKKSCRQGDEALGKSKGGHSTKVHASVDALGNPRRLILTPGQTHDVRTGPALIEGENTEAVIADKAYDSDEFLALIAQMSAEAVIPPKANRIEQREYDENLYADRNKVERFYNKAKQYRRLATRYEKTARNYLAFWHITASVILTL